MSREMWRRCCDKGCAEISTGRRHGDGWYKIRGGFMSWACPKHAAAWHAYDAACVKRENAYDAIYQEEHAAWLAAFEERMSHELPQPVEPPSQPSIDYE